MCFQDIPLLQNKSSNKIRKLLLCKIRIKNVNKGSSKETVLNCRIRHLKKLNQESAIRSLIPPTYIKKKPQVVKLKLLISTDISLELW